MTNGFNVLLVTSWGQKQCGIQAHSEMLIDAVTHASPDVHISPSAEALDPAFVYTLRDYFDIIHLNYHRALHARWTPEVIRDRIRTYGTRVVITFHDTFGEHEPDELSTALHDVADAFIVHEPCLGLPKAHHWRQGVPEPNGNFGPRDWYWNTRPVLGTVGFDFPWKNYLWMVTLAYSMGWGVVICTPEMSKEREDELRARNPWLSIHRNLDTQSVIAALRECDATAFLYVCANSGTSAAIRLAIAARRPIIALSTCRQFRDLHLDPLGHMSIRWAQDEEGVRSQLKFAGSVGRFDNATHNLAEQESWRHWGQKYADLYRSVL